MKSHGDEVKWLPFFLETIVALHTLEALEEGEFKVCSRGEGIGRAEGFDCPIRQGRALNNQFSFAKSLVNGGFIQSSCSDSVFSPSLSVSWRVIHSIPFRFVFAVLFRL